MKRNVFLPTRYATLGADTRSQQLTTPHAVVLFVNRRVEPVRTGQLGAMATRQPGLVMRIHIQSNDALSPEPRRPRHPQPDRHIPQVLQRCPLSARRFRSKHPKGLKTITKRSFSPFLRRNWAILWVMDDGAGEVLEAVDTCGAGDVADGAEWASIPSHPRVSGP